MSSILTPTRAARLSLALIVSFALAACGGSDDAPAAPASASATIGPAGGTLDGPDGSQVVVPAGALAAPVTLSIAESSAGAPALPAGFADGAPMFAMTPHGTAFAVPVTVRVPFDAAAFPAGVAPVLYKTDAAQTGWEIVPGAVVAGGTMQAQIASFSWLIVPVALAPPAIASPPAPQSVVEPAAATFTVGATGSTASGALSFQWKRNGVAIPGATNNSYTTGATSVAADDGAQFSVDVSNRAGTVTSAPATLTVSAGIVAVAITQQPADLTVATGAAAAFSVVATGTSPSYQWQRSNDLGVSFADIPGATAASYTLGAAAAGDSTARFRVRIGNAAGIVTSAPATLTVTATPSAGLLGRIAAGNRFSLAVDAAGVPYSWGNDSAGQLGNGAPNASRSTPAALGTITGVRAVAAGDEYLAVAVRNDGSVWAWGYRGNVDCAVGSIASTPFQVAGASGVVAASTGSDHTLLLRGDGTVLSFGCNGSGQLGRAGTSAPMSPAASVAGLAGIVAVAAGHGFSLALDGAGGVWAWGRPPEDRSGSRDVFAPARIAGLSGVIAISAGREHALALKSDGSVVAWGSNRNGKLGDGTTIDRPAPTATLLTSQVTAIAAGGLDSSLALRADGSVFAWGINETGQLGTGSLQPGFRPTPAAIPGLAGIVAISMGGGLGHGLALRSDGTVHAWGHNDAGQLGDGSTSIRPSPVQVPGLNLN